METEPKEFDSALPSCYDRGKILIEDDSENGSGKGRVGEIIHRPAKDLSLLNGHVEASDGVTRRLVDRVNFLAPHPRVSPSPYLS